MLRGLEIGVYLIVFLEGRAQGSLGRGKEAMCVMYIYTLIHKLEIQQEEEEEAAKKKEVQGKRCIGLLCSFMKEKCVGVDVKRLFKDKVR